MSSIARYAVVCAAFGLLAAGLIAAAIAILPTRQTEDVPVPPRSASAQEVAETYMAALNAHDCGTANDLWVGRNNGADYWCGNVGSLSGASVTTVIPESRQGAMANQDVVNVRVRFDLDWRWLHDDGSFPEGDARWGYLMVRSSDTEPWRIFGEGNG